MISSRNYNIAFWTFITYRFLASTWMRCETERKHWRMRVGTPVSECVFIPARNDFLIRVHFVTSNIKHSQAECVVWVVTQIKIIAPNPEKLVMKEHLKSVRGIGPDLAAQQRGGCCGSLPLGPCWAKGKDHLLPPSAAQDPASLCCHGSRKSMLVFVKSEIMRFCNMSHSSAKIKGQKWCWEGEKDGREIRMHCPGYHSVPGLDF